MKAKTLLTLAVVCVLLFIARIVLVGLDIRRTWLEALWLPVALFAPVGIAYIVFTVWRTFFVIRRYRKRVRENPAQMVPTAAADLTEVIGREELCAMLLDNLRAPDAQPNMIIGGLGSGKTAVLVRLAQVIAMYNGVPVAIRLRDADTGLDFEKRARDRFAELVSPYLLADGNADRIWRNLRRENRIVVLADGLEEALTHVDPGADRQMMIQTAIRDAAESKLPLVIASRFWDPIQRLSLTVTELEPLGEGPALDFLARDEQTARLGLARLIQQADIADSPIYLNVVQQLNRRDKERHLTPGQEWLERITRTSGPLADLAYADHARLRLEILDSWRDALVRGLLYEDYAVSEHQRERALRILSVLACFGAARGSLEAPFDEIVGVTDGPDASAGSPDDRHAHERAQHLAATCLTPTLKDIVFHHAPPPERTDSERQGVRDRLRDECVDAALIGSELGIVEARDTSVRFRQGIVEAYLASRMLPTAFQNQEFRTFALGNCGREFLAGLVLASRRASGVPGSESHLDGAGPAAGPWDGPDAVDKIYAAADHELRPENRLYLYDTAVQIDAVQHSPVLSRNWRSADGLQQPPLVDSIAAYFGRLQRETVGRADRRVLDAQIALTRRIGQAVREIADRLRVRERAGDAAGGIRPEGQDLGLVYQTLLAMAQDHDEHAVELAITQEIADGGFDAFASLQGTFDEWWSQWGRWSRQHAARPDRKRMARSTDGRGHNGSSLSDFTWMNRDRNTAEDLLQRGEICAWLAPLFCSTAVDPNGGPHGVPGGRMPHGESDHPLHNLDTWIEEYLGRSDPEHAGSRPWISLEIALAQGFMLAANRRPANAERYEKRRAILADKAETALRHSRFWFAQLTLIQALALLSLPTDRTVPLQDRGHGSDPRAVVDHWLAIAGSGFAEREHQAGHRVHPLVREAGELAVHTLNTRQPERFCWVDESGTIKQVGSLPSPGSRPQEHRQWLLPSFGWSALHPQAQQLLGNVQVMLNLANRGDRLVDREARLLRTERPELPPCMTRDRTVMKVTATVGSAAVSEPGSSCHDDCALRLCPYPPLGELSYRDDLTEGFCRHLSRTARTESYSRALGRNAVRRFWEDMVARVRPKVQVQGKPSTSRLKV